ncbi:hypothetical protein ZIOFF_039775 [Zingiber officinale]|uniref:DUF8040 domain-containing protein n=1 Tax=Zingiber officinale TaxID=94328 RepID=A0A8J5L3J6_ZINOF|nr:hypothetical protein ZIOFF_039775 [Zingiber officinale]
MNSSFTKLCCMLESEGGLKGTRYMEVDEQVAMSLHLLAHHVKNRTIQFQFKGSGEIINGTHIKVRVPAEDRPRYRTRKDEIATNVFAACSQDMQFTYVLSGWEGSAADSRVP